MTGPSLRLATSVLALVVLLAVVVTTACQPARLSFREPPRGRALKIAIARHPAYAPLALMKERRLLERRLPETSIEWKVFGSVEAMGAALTDRGLDIGTGSPSAFLRIRARGVPVAALGGISRLSVGVVSTDPRVTRLDQLSLAASILVPSNSGAESLFLQNVAIQTVGDATAFTRRVRAESPGRSLEALGSRDGATAVLTKPWLDSALGHPRARLLAASSQSADGAWPTTLAFTTVEILERQREAIPVFVEALVEATAATRESLGDIVDEIFEGDDRSVDREAAVRALGADRAAFGATLDGFANLLDMAAFAGVVPAEIDRASLIIDAQRGGIGVTALSRDRR